MADSAFFMIGRLRDWLLYVYDRHYKKLLVIPFLIVVASIAIISVNYAVTGELFKKDVSLKGGVTVTVLSSEKKVDADGLQFELSRELQRDVSVRALTQGSGFIVESEGGEADVGIILESLEARVGKLSSDQYSVQVIGSALSESFLKEAVISLLAAFVLMGIAVLVYFRVIVPSLFVISAAFSDILSTFAVVVLLNERLSTAGIAAFLMLIGYSVDTDILLTTRVLKGSEGSVFQRTIGAIKTGLFLTLTALAATVTAFVFTQSETIRQIMLVLSIGLVFDMIHTWITNAGVLRWYLESRRKTANEQA